MSYTALYRRYRPDDFAALVGQPHIAKVLSTAIKRESFVHAYLFCGPRGTGKTSSARILARAINCQNPREDGNPCNSCPSCLRSLHGESMDIIEIDGASNRGIDEIRDLRERVKYAPAQERYKIYIIDEVHMLTNDAFNAILKTLEEPPAHVIFIFATTAPHKLPMTVLSRCQRFDFRRISDAEIQEHLLYIAGQEEIAIDGDAAALIARKADGGMRDAVSLLDQCAAASEGRISSSTVTAILGIVDHSFICKLSHHLLEHDIQSALLAVEELVSSGKDLRQAVADLCEELRDSLLAKLADAQSSPYPAQAYLDLLTSLTDADNKLRIAASPRITLELALVRACALTAPPMPPARSAAPQAAAAAHAAQPPAAPKQPADSADRTPARKTTESEKGTADAKLKAAPSQPTPTATTNAAAKKAATSGAANSAPAGQEQRPAAPPPAQSAPDGGSKPATTEPKAKEPAAAAKAAAATTPAATGQQPAEETAPPAQRPATASGKADDSGLDKIITQWPTVLEVIESLNPSTFFRVENCQVSLTAAGELLLQFPADRSGDYQYIHGSQEQKAVISEAIKRVCGCQPTLRGQIGDFYAPEEEQPEPPPTTDGGDGEAAVEQESLF